MRRETSLSSQVAVDNSNNYKFCIHSDFVVVNSCGYFIARKRYKRSTNIEIHTIHKNKYKHKSWQWKRLLRAAPSEASDHQRSSDQFLGRKKIEGREREGNTPTRSGLLRRGADAGGRRSRGGMPTWSSRAAGAEWWAARWFVKSESDLWKLLKNLAPRQLKHELSWQNSLNLLRWDRANSRLSTMPPLDRPSRCNHGAT